MRDNRAPGEFRRPDEGLQAAAGGTRIASTPRTHISGASEDLQARPTWDTDEGQWPRRWGLIAMDGRGGGCGGRRRKWDRLLTECRVWWKSWTWRSLYSSLTLSEIDREDESLVSAALLESTVK